MSKNIKEFVAKEIQDYISSNPLKCSVQMEYIRGLGYKDPIQGSIFFHFHRFGGLLFKYEIMFFMSFSEEDEYKIEFQFDTYPESFVSRKNFFDLIRLFKLKIENKDFFKKDVGYLFEPMDIEISLAEFNSGQEEDMLNLGSCQVPINSGTKKSVVESLGHVYKFLLEIYSVAEILNEKHAGMTSSPEPVG